MVDYFRLFFYILIVIATVILTGAAQTPTGSINCHAIKSNMAFSEWKSCTVYEDVGFGSSAEYVVLDFSLADPVDIKGFFDQATNPTYLKAGIKIVGNEKIETLNLENIKDWSATKTPTNVLFIDISHNLNLKEIKWDAGIFEPSPGNLVQILIYNNPKLTLSSSLEVKLLEKASNVTSYIQHNPTDCMFQHPNGGNFYHIPSQEMLDYCGTIKGDLILENVKLTKELKIIEPGCLALANVNMEEGKVDIGDFKNANQKCKNGNDSLIINNPGLCGDKLSKLMEYFPAGSKPEVRLDTASCTQDECGKSDAQHKYKMCKKITESVDITSWFEDGAVDKKSQLESAAGFTLTIANSSTIKLSMPNLTAAEGLEIMDNKKLKELDLSQLTSLKTMKLTGNQIEELHLPNLVKLNTLKLTGNPKLKLDKLQQLNVTVADMKQSKVECYTDMDSNGAFTVTNISQIRLCTHIIGKFIIRGLQKNVDPATVHLREIKGCLEIRDTKLTEVKFLDNVNFDVNGCIGGRHLLTDNPDLCPPNYEMKKVTFVATGGKTFGCGKLCRKLEKGCTVLNGSLTIDSKTTEKELSYLAELGIVYGSVKIDGTTRTALEFPKLTEIHSATAPALQISNNEKLQAVKMEKLKTITVADGKKPKIKIIKNPQLTNQKTFVPGNMKCGEDEKSDCYLVEVKEKEVIWYTTTTWIAIFSSAGAVVVGALVATIVVIVHFRVIIPAEMRKVAKIRDKNRKRRLKREAEAKKFYTKGEKKKHGELQSVIFPAAAATSAETTTPAAAAATSAETTSAETTAQKEEKKRIFYLQWANLYTGRKTKSGKGWINADGQRRPFVRKCHPPWYRCPEAREKMLKRLEQADNQLMKAMKKKEEPTQTTNSEKTGSVSKSATKTDPNIPLDDEPKTAIGSVEPEEDVKTAKFDDGTATAYLPPEPEPEPEEPLDPRPKCCVNASRTFLEDMRDELLLADGPYSRKLANLIIYGIMCFEPNRNRRYLYDQEYQAKDLFNARDIYFDTDVVLSVDKGPGGYEATATGSLIDKMLEKAKDARRANILHVGRKRLHTFKGLYLESSKPVESFDNKTCSAFMSHQVHYGTISKSPLVYERGIYVVNIEVDDTPGDNFTKYAELPWLDILHEAKKKKAVIHTTSAKFYLFLQFILATEDVLVHPRKYSYEECFEGFGFGIYQRFMNLYNPEVKAIDSYTLWAMHMLWNAKQLYEKEAVRNRTAVQRVQMFGRAIKLLPTGLKKKLAQQEEDAQEPVYDVENYELKLIEDNLFIHSCLLKRLPNGQVDQNAPLRKQAIIKWNEGHKRPKMPKTMPSEYQEYLENVKQWTETYRVTIPGPGDNFNET